MSLRSQFSKNTEVLRITLARLNREYSDKNKSLPLQQFKREKRKGTAPDSNQIRIRHLESEIASIRTELAAWETIFQAEEKQAKVLDLSNRKLTRLPEVIFHLTKLTSLRLSNNQLTTLPSEISQLTELTSLDLSLNFIETLPSEIVNLTSLTTLVLSNNKFVQFQVEIAQLKELRYLVFANNEVSSLPIEISQLHRLLELHLRGNRLSELPIELQQIEGLKALDLRDNELPILPEILEKVNEPQLILDYYFSHSLAKKRPINEAKVLVIGQGSVGKTSLIERIIFDRFDPNQKMTDGIAIKQWELGGNHKKQRSIFINWNMISSLNTSSESNSIRLNIWDFGGQEIMHATHQFFLTKRSLYLLVLDARLTQEENRVEYWLKLIQSLGGDSPVLIVGNKTDEHPLDIDRTGLQKKYSNIVNILETSAATGAGIDELRAEIFNQINVLSHVRDLLPEPWFAIKARLESLGKNKNYINHDEYLSLCNENKILDEPNQRNLIGILHDLGIVIHFQDDPRLESLGILNPEWVTQGVYKILNSHELFQNKGRLTLPMLNDILNLPQYPRDKRLFIVDMMKKFELCYNIEPDQSFLIPDLLPKDEPFTGDWENTLHFQYHYDILPSSIISRFIVRMNAFIEKTVWRSGVILKSGRNNALVKSDTEDRKVYIWVSGDENTRRDFLSAIRMEFETIYKTLPKLEVSPKVPHPSHHELILDYEELIEFERQNITEFPRIVGSQVVKCDVKALLAGVEGSKSSSVFVSYAHADEKFVKKLIDELKKAEVSMWQDAISLDGGDIWPDEMERGLLQSKICMVVLSPDSVNSKWVKKEYTFADTLRKTIVPIICRECDIPFLLNNIQYIDFTKMKYRKAFTKLLDVLRNAK